VEKGERVVGTAQMAGTEMMRIADLKSIEAQVEVGENDIPKVKIGDTALVTIDAYNNRKFKGVVYKIANPQTGSSSSTTTNATVTNYKVHIRLLQSSYQDLIRPGVFPFRPNMTASADIQTQTKVNVMSVPILAVTTRSEKGDAKDKAKKNGNATDEQENNTGTEADETVFVLQPDGTVKSLQVKTGIQDINYIEVTSGIADTLRVVSGPSDAVNKTLKDGAKVKVVSKDELTESFKKK
jgi:HlyD family secretion protein